MSTTLSSERLILRPWREGDLDAAAHRRAVDEGEGRDGQVGDRGEGGVAGLGDLGRLLALRHRGHAREVRADGEDERLAGDGNRLDLACLGPLAQAGDGLGELGDARLAEGVRLGV